MKIMSLQRSVTLQRLIRYGCKMALDLFSVLLATVIALALDGQEQPALFSVDALIWLGVHIMLCGVVFAAFRVYQTSYRYFGVRDVLHHSFAFAIVLLGEILFAVFYDGLNISCAAVFDLSFFILLLFDRSIVRFIITLKAKKQHSKDGKRAIVVGGGAAGALLIRELQATNMEHFLPVAVLDDDPTKLGASIGGVRVVGRIDDVATAVEKYQASHILVALPSVKSEIVREIYKKCQLPGVKVQTVPGLYQLASGEMTVTHVRDVSVEDLLGRDEVKVNLDEIMGYISDSVVLVTGGGGSIGSELCCQIAAHRPRQLIIFDIYENNAYDIEQELKRRYAALNLLTLIGSVRDMGKLESVFQKYHPDIVFNAAAHKHVPLMETSPNEAVKNNVFGTLNVARCADKYGVKRFVQISTDKAVNPTNIMGATKRICEMIIQTIGRHSQTRFVAVRFGNVLGSNGSVIPLFKKQIAEGGPVTVTDKRIVRYFMTIPEAVSLVLQAGAYAKCGEIFVLDMGEQVRIYDLAENLIRLSGYVPGRDIEIVCTGLRPGEKLYEERLMSEEGLQQTENKMISIGKPLDVDEDRLFQKLDELYQAAYEETDRMKELVHELVPTYTIDKR